MTGPAEQPQQPLRIKEMRPDAIRAAIAADARLIVPVGTCEQHGAHLPLGCDTMVVERLADDLSAEFGILRSPTLEYGVNNPIKPIPAGNAGLRRKTLRRMVNDLVIDWEREGVREFLLLTMHGHAPHQEALGTVVTTGARVRLIDILALDFSSFVEVPGGPIHGGEIDTSLVLFVAPQLVHLPAARDFILPEVARERYRRGSNMYLSPDVLSLGAPSRASAEKGRRIYELIQDRIRTRVLAPNPNGAKG